MIYPWWQTGFYLFNRQNINPGIRAFFRKKERSVDAYATGNDQRFVNTQPWPVFIDEIRFFQRARGSSTAYYNMFDAFAVKMRTSREGEIFSKFMPISSLFYSDPMRFDPRTARCGGKFTLPQPMHLDGSENFAFRVYPGGAAIDTVSGFQIGLLGFDEKNQAPVVRTAEPVTVAAGQRPTDYVLDAGRDKNVRDLTLEEISFSNITGSVASFWDIELDIEPPYGPQWTDDASTYPGFIVDQLPNWLYEKGAVVMQPQAPLMIYPGGNMIVELITTPLATQLETQVDSPCWIACMLFGHQEVPDDYHR